MENPLTVQAKINELNAISTQPGQPIVNEWIAFQGYSAIIYATIPAYVTPSAFAGLPPMRHPTFNPSAGIAVKAFMNSRTGEIKMFNAYMFEQ